jgi:hypothetical protein
VSSDVSEEHIASIFRVEEISSASKQVASKLTLNGLHDVISQKLILFITTALKTSNPMKKGLFDPVSCICTICSEAECVMPFGFQKNKT